MMMRCLQFAALIVVSYGALIAQPHTLQVFNTSNSPLQENTIRTLAVAPDSVLWVGTENGLATLKNGSWATIDTFENLQIRAIAFDTAGHAWVGTFLHGVWVQTINGWTNYLPSNSNLPSEHVRTISFCPNGDTWIGTLGGAVYINNGVWTVYQQTNANWYGDNIGASYCGNNNDIWLGGVNNGLMHLRDTTWVIYRSSNSNLPDNTILDLKGNAQGDILLAMPYGGTAVFDGNQGWILYNTTNSFIPANSINEIAIGSDGNTYYATANKGLTIYKGGMDWSNIDATTRPDTNGLYLPDNEMLAVVQDAQGVIWGSIFNKGLVRIEFIDSTVSSINSIELTNISIYPNPTQDYIVVNAPVSNLGISIIDVLGTELYTTSTTSLNTKIPLSYLPKGTYMVVLQSGSAITTQRLIKY